jgi:hypothetical protein
MMLRAILAAAALPAALGASFVVNVSDVVQAPVSRRIMGCHHDYGFAQAPRGFYSEMVYGTSFDAGTQAVPAWHPFWLNSSAAPPKLTAYTSFSARPTLALALDHDGATLGMANRGIGNAGLFLQAGKPYSVEFWAWCGAGAGNEPTVYVELVDFTDGNASLARADLKLVSTGPPWGTNWFRFNATLTPSAGTQCVGIPFGSDPTIDCGVEAGPAHVCVRCGGEFRIALTGPQSYGGVNLAYASLKPGPWGLVQAKDGSSIDVLKSAGDALTAMGVTLMRNGGSVSQSMRWKDWRGALWNRPSSQQVWGFSLLSGWGPFEFADLGAALDIEPVITLAYDSNDATDFADLVEYCFGNASTSWGARRIADGHAAVYDIRVFELGNEQVNPFFVDQVAAMEARRAAVGAPPLYYMYPQNEGLDAASAQRYLDLGLDPSRVLPDLHVGAGGAAEDAAALFARPPVPGFAQGAINAETNAGSHDHARALAEAADLIDWTTQEQGVASRLYGRTASFCSGSSNNFDSWDQGISFFLPNMTWLQPPGYVHVMFAQTWAETTVRATRAADGPVTYTLQTPGGFLADGDDVWSGLATLAQAEALCTFNFSGCVGITFAGADPSPTTPVQMYLKSAFQFSPASGWNTYESSRELNSLPFSAQLTGGGGKTLVVRAVNAGNASAPLAFSLAGAAFSGADGDGWTLSAPSGSADNTPGNPTAVAPVRAPVPVAAGASWAGALAPFSFFVASFALA